MAPRCWLVVWSYIYEQPFDPRYTNGKEIIDHWIATDTYQEAETKYEKLLKDPNIYAASIAAPVKSTDY